MPSLPGAERVLLGWNTGRPHFPMFGLYPGPPRCPRACCGGLCFRFMSKKSAKNILGPIGGCGTIPFGARTGAFGLGHWKAAFPDVWPVPWPSPVPPRVLWRVVLPIYVKKKCQKHSRPYRGVRHHPFRGPNGCFWAGALEGRISRCLACTLALPGTPARAVAVRLFKPEWPMAFTHNI